jgi:hypothetical protein
MKPIYKMYHSFEEWQTMSQQEKSHWYQVQDAKTKKGFNKPSENEAEEIERIERRNSQQIDNLQTTIEINF